jgi:hypothetical protein
MANKPLRTNNSNRIAISRPANSIGTFRVESGNDELPGSRVRCAPFQFARAVGKSTTGAAWRFAKKPAGSKFHSQDLDTIWPIFCRSGEIWRSRCVRLGQTLRLHRCSERLLRAGAG